MSEEPAERPDRPEKRAREVTVDPDDFDEFLAWRRQRRNDHGAAHYSHGAAHSRGSPPRPPRHRPPAADRQLGELLGLLRRQAQSQPAQSQPAPSSLSNLQVDLANLQDKVRKLDSEMQSMI